MEQPTLPEIDIVSIIPQNHPFVMVDKLLACTQQVIKTTFKIKIDNILVEDGELSAAGLVENIAQTAAAGSGYKANQTGTQIAEGYIGAIKNLRIFALPKTDDVIETTVTVMDKVFSVTFISGRVVCKNQLLAICEMKIFSSNN